MQKLECTFSSQSWINTYQFDVYSVRALTSFPLSLQIHMYIHAHVPKQYIFSSRNGVTFNLIGFVSPLAQQSWKKNLKRNSTASLNTVLLPLTGKILLFQGKRERLEVAHLNNQNPIKVNYHVQYILKQHCATTSSGICTFLLYCYM